jgi:hypothetical protein
MASIMIKFQCGLCGLKIYCSINSTGQIWSGDLQNKRDLRKLFKKASGSVKLCCSCITFCRLKLVLRNTGALSDKRQLINQILTRVSNLVRVWNQPRGSVG